ncbi:MAG: SdrD B-like domain-containing protein [Caldilineaceae bacterium]
MSNQILQRLRCNWYKLSLGILLILLTAAFWPATAQAQAAQPDPTVCYAIADNQGKLPGGVNANDKDELVQLNRFTAATAPIGATGTTNIEAEAFVMENGTDILYAENGGVLGTINLATGAFTAIGPAGTGAGTAGNVNFNDIDGISYDRATKTLYGTLRRSTANDLLLKINLATGAHVPNAFGAGQDYLVIPAPAGFPTFTDVDDLTFDPTNGDLYATIDDGGTGGILVKMDKNTAAITIVGAYNDTSLAGNLVDDIEGLSFDMSGQLYGSTGNNGPDAGDKNRLFKLNKATGAATLIGPFPTTFVDYESLGCLTQLASITLKKYTNGQDADTPPGPTVPVGSPIVWTYVITNTGGVTLTNLGLTDDKLGTITCNEGPIPNLAPNQHFTCTVNGTATTVGQYANIGTITANWTNPNGVFTVTSTDPSHYFGSQPGITLQKTVYAGHNAGASCPGSELVTGKVGDPVTYCFVVTNTSNTYLTGIKLDDTTLGIARANLTLVSGTEPLAPNASLIFYYETTLSKNLVNTAVTTGTPSDSNGTPIPGQNNVSAQDTAEVQVTPSLPLGSLGDTVWQDTNGNGVQDNGEPGIPNVKLILIDSNGVTKTVTTDQNGVYHFTDLPAGNYTVRVDATTLPPGLQQTFDLDGINTPNITAVTLAAGQNRIDVDFGYQPVPVALLGSLGDFVWQDTNGNGIQDSGEAGIPNIRVSLLDSVGNPLQTTTTDATGHYLFSNLPAGSYTVVFASPGSGFFFSPPSQGSDPALDSNPDQNGHTGVIQLSAGQNDRTVDAGIFAPPNLTIKKSDGRSGSSVQPGDTIVYSFVFTNTGQGDALGVVLKEIVPQFTTFNASQSTPGWNCAGGSIAAGTVCTFAIGTVAAKTSVNSTIKFAVKLDSPMPSEAKAIVNEVVILDDGSHGNPPGGQNNSSSVRTEVVPPTGLPTEPEPAATRVVFLPLVQAK